ncbi:MAG: hypothetical protein ACFE8N_11150 [Promethearchaeota archaeon]
MPIFSCLIDDDAVNSKKKKEGIYQFTYIFIPQIGIAINALVYGLYIFL